MLALGGWLCALVLGAPGVDTELDVDVGYADLTVRDTAATNLPYRSTGFDGQLGVGQLRPRLRWTVDVGIAVGPYFARDFPHRAIVFGSENAAGEVESVAVPMRGLMTAPRLHTRLEYRWIAADRVDVLAGGRVHWDVRYPVGFVGAGLYQLLSLQPTVAVRLLPAPAHAIEIGASLTAVGWRTRAPWHQSVSLPDTGKVAGWFRQGSRVASLGSLQTIAIDVGYAYRIRPRWSVGAAWALWWLHDAQPRPMTSTQQRLTAGFGVHW